MSSSLTLTAVLADRLHAALLADPVLTVDDVYGHPAVAGLHPETVGQLLDVLLAEHRIDDDEYGRLIIAPGETA